MSKASQRCGGKVDVAARIVDEKFALLLLDAGPD